MEAWIGELWLEYRREVTGLYEAPEEWMLGEGLREESLARVLELADQIDGGCSALIADGDDEEAPTALIASAAVDASVAADVLIATLDSQQSADLGLGEEARARTLEEGQPPEAEREALAVLLRQGDEAFLGETAIGGAAPPVDARERAQQGIDDLLGQAAPVAGAFALGTVTFGGSELIALLGQVDVLRQAAEAAQSIFHKGLALLRRAIRKLMKALGGSATALEVVGAFASSELANEMQEWAGGLRMHAVRAITKAAEAEAELELLAGELEQMDERDARSLSSRLDRLCRSYGKRMRCARAVRVALRIAAPPVAATTGGTSVAVVAGVNATGLTYVLYSLAVRLGTAPAPFTRGVPALAREALGEGRRR
jgi:hypothetical protein